MTYVVTEACIEHVFDRSCLEDCPADCIYQGDRKMYSTPSNASTAERASRPARWRPHCPPTYCLAHRESGISLTMLCFYAPFAGAQRGSWNTARCVATRSHRR